ncbi:uncharacterized protein GGS22DRAFT_186953 [Annulohypoxylon maeteangense]|uniref:uncharacterized protein n=1 Tax=Annulohypoxylon maeteangense TaxID=1927788 RepID=UPI0020085190|nr:uncharacterized protein GGS22DRAFT_186953 [Annulohypoxylon maeteangense]KAI0886878.1 hypothetical protein GGS22DRAFT_186953 [Annulohypoxylon maeteangense]
MTGTPKGSRLTIWYPSFAPNSDSLAAFGTLAHDTHRRRRATISPLFSKGACAASESNIYKNIELLLAYVDDQIRTTGSAEMRKIYLAFTTDTLSDHCFGRSTGLLLDDQAALNWQKTIKAVAIVTRRN